MTFKEYLKLGVDKDMWGDTPELDFAKDVLTDKNFRDFKKWEELETYIRFHGADSAVVKAAKSCFKKWKKYTRRKMGYSNENKILGY